jgi:thymidylate synthase (FAD)
MKIVQPSFEILSTIDDLTILRNLEIAGRTCYKSEDKITDTSAKQFVKSIINRGHESVLEHEKITVKFINDRGVSHEEVRHRIASFSQESTRYINYTKENKGGECSFINIEQHLSNPTVSLNIWLDHMAASETAYKAMIDAGERAEIARSVLPNSLKTEIVITANLREWRTMFKQRTSAAAHPQIREVMCPLLTVLKQKLPVIFDDIENADYVHTIL